MSKIEKLVEDLSGLTVLEAADLAVHRAEFRRGKVDRLGGRAQEQQKARRAEHRSRHERY